ncbi:MAG: 2-amino-4-hydroxy-6-hydroxymethyldihydropteridine diphosphokinase [Kiritimatiellae bacterium]|nr:2-amino-4-hydroxy-6-hydroxymethyldihydropteridine diphosphokinase [Kiritimatiellia bacterium]
MRERSGKRVFLSVGSNLEPQIHIPRALDLLLAHVRVTGVSTFYRTAPAGGRRQPDFANGVWRVETRLDAVRLKGDVLRAIEAELGRVRGGDRFADRTIDLDIVAYGDLVLRTPDLTLPDPDIRTRAFVALPLLELAPDLVLADTGEPLLAIAHGMSRAGMSILPELTERLRERIRR